MSTIPKDAAIQSSAYTPGKVTAVWDATGDRVFDDTQGFTVLTTVCAQKGQYRADRTFGTLVRSRTSDTRATGSQLAADALDGMRQVAGNKLIPTAGGEAIQSYSARPERLPHGWRLVLSWQSNGSQVEPVAVRF